MPFAPSTDAISQLFDFFGSRKTKPRNLYAIYSLNKVSNVRSSLKRKPVTFHTSCSKHQSLAIYCRFARRYLENVACVCPNAVAVFH